MEFFFGCCFLGRGLRGALAVLWLPDGPGRGTADAVLTGEVRDGGGTEIRARPPLDDSSCLMVRLADGRRGAEGPGVVRREFPGEAVPGARRPAAEPLVGGWVGGEDPCAVLDLESR